ncbi:MAG: protoheme IX farnesyltransferase [Flavobacteriales bacterium]|nr:protoheme IX farnesyltransferase [Flavobacteriales bacterium]|tara:strand:- start:3802 stop:4677 length:876 start_codon:yes stop_codon:yes gene_type:complete
MPSFADVVKLTKVRLTSSVVFSAIAGYFIAANQLNTLLLIYLVLGGFFVVAASNGFNQLIEKDYDKLMQRTADRPLPTKRMSSSEVFWISFLMALLGIFLLYKINFLTGFFGTLSIFLYVLIYTPLKRVSPISVFVGAFPGAIPFMLGWVAATNDFDIEPGILFAIQFIWQFPHFWAIAWVCNDDYEKAGFIMLPGKKDKSTAWKNVVYTFFLIPLSVLPVFGITGNLQLSLIAAIFVLIAGIWFFSIALNLYKKLTDESAKKLMFASFIYLPSVQLIFVLDKVMRGLFVI